MSDDSSSTVTKQKHTAGRKKIVIKKIENMGSLQVTFSKRRGGLFRKASQLSALCGAEVAVLVFSPHGRPYVFGHPSVDSVISRLESTSTALHGGQHACMHASNDDEDDSRGSVVESTNLVQSSTAYRTRPDPKSLCLRVGDSRGKEIVMAEAESGDGEFWWDQPTEKMKLQELKQFRSSLEELRAKVVMQLDEIAMRNLAVRNFLV